MNHDSGLAKSLQGSSRRTRWRCASVCAGLTLWLAVAVPRVTAQVPDASENLGVVEVAQSGEQLQLAMNFRDATLQTVLEYLSEQAGLIVINDLELDSRITVFSRQPMSLTEAIDLLNSVLKEKGYAAIRRERLLRVVPIADAKLQSIPVRMGSDPQSIGQSDTIITQVIPIKYADAENMAKDLAPLVSESFGQLTANKSSNSLIVTNTEANIHRIAQIAQALDQSISQVKIVRVFHLEYAEAKTAATLINETFKEQSSSATSQLGRAIRQRFGGRFGGQPAEGENEEQGGAAKEVAAAADERTNSVVVSAAPEVMQVIATVLTELDKDTTAKEGVLIYRAKNATATELETLVNTLFEEDTSNVAGNQAQRNGGRRGLPQQTTETASSAADLVGNVTAVADESTNTLLVLAAERNFPRLRAILEDLDRPVPQVLVRVLIAELSHDKTYDVGTEISANASLGGGSTLLQSLTTFGAATNGLSFLVLNDDYTASIHALETVGALDVLSRPYILTRDNQEARILVGEEFPLVTNTRTTDAGNTLNTIEYEDIGIILGVTPQINDEGLVVLNVTQELSSILESTVQISENLNAARIAKRTAETRIAVHDGQTVVLGGLMQDEVTKTVRKVPLLGDLPLIGGLFKRTQESTTKTELLLFLTPEVVMDPADLVGVTQKIRSDSESLENTIEPGALQRHLDAMRGRDRNTDGQWTPPRQRQ